LDGVVKILRSLHGRFLWDYEDGREKISWVSWKKLCSLKKHGGFGVKDISLFNVALLVKWR